MQPKTLFGNFQRDGLILTQHQAGSPFSASLPNESLHILINIEGSGIILGEALRLSLTPGTIAIFHRCSANETSAVRLKPENEHLFLILTASTNWIQKTFGAKSSALHPSLRNTLDSKSSTTFSLSKIRPMSLNEIELSDDLISPPVNKDAAPFWYTAKIIELLTLHLFTPKNLTENRPFCSDLKHSQRERSDKCIRWLKLNLDQPLDLPALAKSVGVAPSYLSRQFSTIEEAAMEVGYNSLSHFTKAFLEEKGTRPSEFIAKNQ